MRGVTSVQHDLQIICHSSKISLRWPTFKGKQGSVRVCVRNNAPYSQKTSLRVGNSDAPISKTFLRSMNISKRAEVLRQVLYD